MSLQIQINRVSTILSDYIGWTPVPCTIDTTGITGRLQVTLKNRQPSAGGQVVFYEDPLGDEQPELELVLTEGDPPPILYVGGKFGSPSLSDKDAAITVADQNGNILQEKQLMIRIRKNAEALTIEERKRFLSAFGILNSGGVYADFRNMHDRNMSAEAHGYPGFLPWHRAYLLDLERELQKIDPSVALPYWKFDEPATSLFSKEFLGHSNGSGWVEFNTDNPLNSWIADGVAGIDRRHAPQWILNEGDTLNLGREYRIFVGMEGQPHGAAHMNFRGFISNAHTAPKDPLFFLLHANVDRLWAKWQWINRLFDPTDQDSYEFQDSFGSPGAERIGHNRLDTLWPWNGIINANNRPPTAPGGLFPSLDFPIAPGDEPTIGDMIDYQGRTNAAYRLGFDYDDVPYEA